VNDAGRIGIGGVFDCFADGAFRQLQTGSDGTLSFRVQIYAFDYASYTAQNANGQLDQAATDWDSLQKFNPTYQTTCTATQQVNVEVLAVCEPLTSAGTSFRIDTSHFATTLGVDLGCNVAYSSVQGSFKTGTTTGDLPSVACPQPIVVSSAQAPATYDMDLRLLDAAQPPRVVATVHCHASTKPRTQTVAVCDPAAE
jgi:hypothetical protein